MVVQNPVEANADIHIVMFKHTIMLEPQLVSQLTRESGIVVGNRESGPCLQKAEKSACNTRSELITDLGANISVIDANAKCFLHENIADVGAIVGVGQGRVPHKGRPDLKSF